MKRKKWGKKKKTNDNKKKKKEWKTKWLSEKKKQMESHQGPGPSSSSSLTTPHSLNLGLSERIYGRRIPSFSDFFNCYSCNEVMGKFDKTVNHFSNTSIMSCSSARWLVEFAGTDRHKEWRTSGSIRLRGRHTGGLPRAYLQSDNHT